MQQSLKKFNKSIEISVSVDMIASQLLKAMDQSNPNAALIVNTVIGSSLSTGKIGFVYNAINGWQDEINVTIDKEYLCLGSKLDMYRPADGQMETMHKCIVQEIDEFRDGNKINVSFTYIRKGNNAGDEPVVMTSKTWVDHNCLVDQSAE